jgi:SAM-dependent methyltransferase
MDVLSHNKRAWDKKVEGGDRWTVPVSADAIARARRGDWEVILTPMRPVPADWFPDLKNKPVLCLASGGGQQAPILAAAGAIVSLLDNSPKQLAQDLEVARRENLKIFTVEGDMANLDCFEDETFEVIFHPCSNCFAPAIRPVWKEAYRVLKKGGVLLSGFVNPVALAVDPELEKNGPLQIKYSIPYSDLKSLPAAQLQKLLDDGEPLAYGHSLEDQIGGQIDAGFSITGFYEDSWDKSPLHSYLDVYIATRALKPRP